MKIAWTPELATGDHTIDTQHKELLDRINALLDICAGRTPRSQAGRVIDFLEEYVVSHFGREEQLMVETNYPEYHRHKEEHTLFLVRFSDVKQKFHDEGAAVEVLHLATRTLIEWLNVHIKVTDRRLGAYLQDHGGRKA